MLSWPEASYELIKKIISLSLHKSSQTNIMSASCVKFWMVAVFQYDFVSLSITPSIPTYKSFQESWRVQVFQV